MSRIFHEEPKIMLSNFVEVLADELEIEIRELGALTLEREDLTRAIEPDTCFYIQNELVIRSREEIDLPNDPPPDLAIESDNTNSSINKHSIYAALGVPELWRYRKQQLEIYQLVSGQYVQVDRSLAFPCLPVVEIPRLIERSKEIGQRSTVRLFRKHIRALLQQPN
ncbi:MAG: Uma2 family endonuclease [Leptolyngbyaceae cyanobacterium]